MHQLSIHSRKNVSLRLLRWQALQQRLSLQTPASLVSANTLIAPNANPDANHLRSRAALAGALDNVDGGDAESNSASVSTSGGGMMPHSVGEVSFFLSARICMVCDTRTIPLSGSIVCKSMVWRKEMFGISPVQRSCSSYIQFGCSAEGNNAREE